MVRWLILLAMLWCMPVNAKVYHLQLGYGRLALIDMGSLVESKPLVVDDSLARVYLLSGLDDESDKSVIAVQGLKPSGETDLTVVTQSGIYQFHLVLGDGAAQDLSISNGLSRSWIYSKQYFMAPGRSTIVELPNHINEYVLAGDPDLIGLKQVKGFYDQGFLKVFALLSGNNQGITDVVVPTQSGVYKFQIKVGGSNETHNNIIKLGS